MAVGRQATRGSWYPRTGGFGVSMIWTNRLSAIKILLEHPRAWWLRPENRAAYHYYQEGIRQATQFLRGIKHYARAEEEIVNGIPVRFTKQGYLKWPEGKLLPEGP